MSIVKPNETTHRNGVSSTHGITAPISSTPSAATDVSIESVDPNFRYETTRVVFDKHKASQALLKNIHDQLDPMLLKIQEEHPEALPQLAEVLDGATQRVRLAYEEKKKLERRGHGRR